MIGTAFPIGTDDKGKIVSWNTGKTPHLLLTGPTGSGKTVMTNSLIASAIEQDWRILYINFAGKGDESRWAAPWFSAAAPDGNLDHADQILLWLTGEMASRSKMLAEHGVDSVDKLPHAIRPDPILLVVDDMNCLFSRLAAPHSNPSGDPNVRSLNSKQEQLNQTIVVMNSMLESLTTDGNATGIHLLAAGQFIGHNIRSVRWAIDEGFGIVMFDGIPANGLIPTLLLSPVAALQREQLLAQKQHTKGEGIYLSDRKRGQFSCVKSEFSSSTELSKRVSAKHVAERIDFAELMQPVE